MPWINSPQPWRFMVKVNYIKGIPAGEQLVSAKCASYGVKNGKCEKIKRPKEAGDDSQTRS